MTDNSRTCQICGINVDSHSKSQVKNCLDRTGKRLGYNDKTALRTAHEMKLIKSIGQPDEDKNIFEIMFANGRKAITGDLATTIFKEVLLNVDSAPTEEEDKQEPEDDSNV